MMYFDSFYETFDEAAAREELLRLHEEARRANERVAAAEAAIAAYTSWKDTRNGGSAARSARVAADLVIESDQGPVMVEFKSNESPTSRNNILSLIDSGADDDRWTIPRVAKTLGLGPDAHHKIGVALSRLARGNKVRRSSTGIYMKLLPASVATEAGEEGEARKETLLGSWEGPRVAET
jgi:hypothetical protein